ncbi:uncharacterized protein LOC105841038 [Monomorium pharaonis]|uniref:uncharacterized protein LOC105841038 n=1 Tax=Monomorium pharaonis TaxID=307658 RepID=UPI00063FB121|nr:uncharacterized protein LOC105841038 [Monomorium pharaonis]
MEFSRQPRYVIRKDENSKPKELMSRREAMAEQYRIIKNWKPLSDVWPLRLGRSILVAAATATGMYINHRFRVRMKLRSYGVFPTMIGLSVAPAAFTAISHTEFILNKLVLLEISCPLCLESRSALAQTCSGLFAPLILAPLANFSVSAGSGMYNVPYVKDIRAIFRTILSIYHPMIPKIAMLFTFHALLASFITYSEIKSFLRMSDLQYLKEEEKKERFKNDIF